MKKKAGIDVDIVIKMVLVLMVVGIVLWMMFKLDVLGSADLLPNFGNSNEDRKIEFGGEFKGAGASGNLPDIPKQENSETGEIGRTLEDDCLSCGKGWRNICDKEECEGLGNCEYKSNWGGLKRTCVFRSEE